MGYNSRISLCNIETVPNVATGRRHFEITNETVVYADLQEVGMNEYYSAAGNGTELVAVYEVPADKYHGERYLIDHTPQGDKTYQITRAAKGRNRGYIKLPVKECDKKLESK